MRLKPARAKSERRVSVTEAGLHSIAISALDEKVNLSFSLSKMDFNSLTGTLVGVPPPKCTCVTFLDESIHGNFFSISRAMEFIYSSLYESSFIVSEVQPQKRHRLEQKGI